MYQATICLPKYKKLEGSDNLLIANINGYTVLTNKEKDQTELQIFFPVGGEINQEFLSKTNSFRAKYNLNIDPKQNLANNDSAKGGFFEDDRRVRAIAMRGARSEGCLFPVSLLELLNIDISNILIDNNIDKLVARDGTEILLCQKYIPVHTREARSANKQQQMRSPNLIPDFDQHIDTLQLRQNIHSIPFGKKILVTEKYHGTSGRTGNVEVFNRLNRFQLFINSITVFLFGIEVFTSSQYEHVSGTRRTILKIDTAPYYRKIAHELLVPFLSQLKKNTIIYYEIVGYEMKTKDSENFSPFFTHNIDKTNKILYKKYGSQATYTYGCKKDDPLPFKIIIYRVKTNDIEWSLADIRSTFAEQHSNIEVPEVIDEIEWTETSSKEELIARIEAVIETLHTWADHPSEGVVIRIEDALLPVSKQFMKWKSWPFAQLEDIMYSNPDYKDIEDEN